MYSDEERSIGIKELDDYTDHLRLRIAIKDGIIKRQADKIVDLQIEISKLKGTYVDE